MYQPLVLKYRPQNFKDLVGQKATVRVLQNIVKSEDIFPVMIFAGPRGIGKTTVARIFSKAVNCLGEDKPCGSCKNCKLIEGGGAIDIVEIDGASSGLVDDIRELKEEARYSTSLLNYKVYIIDEVHSMSAQAFNAFLKLLEEPPKGVIFILATTEFSKIPETIVSRSMYYEFRKISENDIIERLKVICEKESIECECGVMAMIAKYVDGGLRDAIGLLEQLKIFSSNNIKVSHFEAITGSLSLQKIIDFINYVIEKDVLKGFGIVDKYLEGSSEVSRFIYRVLEYLREMMLYKLGSESVCEEMKAQAMSLDSKVLQAMIRFLWNEYVKARGIQVHAQVFLESVFLGLIARLSLSKEKVTLSVKKSSSKKLSVEDVKSMFKK